MESDYKIKFEYYRVPLTNELLPAKGRPNYLETKRYFRGDGFPNYPLNQPSAKGGITICRFTINGKEQATRAFCSHSDNFCYQIGREIALGRAKKQLEKETKQ